MAGLKKYDYTTENGYTTTLLLTEEDAKARGLVTQEAAAKAKKDAAAKAEADAKAKEEADAKAAAEAKAKEEADAKAAASQKQAPTPQNKQTTAANK